MELEEGEIVLCTVERIDKANVFVKIDNNGEGTITMSEIASGRIRNIRDYVVPKKRIVCKILKISHNRIELSLRRVSQKEREEILNQEKQERNYMSLIKAVTKEKSQEIIDKIKEKNNLIEFIQESIESPKELEKICGKENANKIIDVIKNQKQTKSIIKKEFKLKSTAPNGIKLIKDLLLEIEKGEIKYISAGRYSIKIENKDKKTAGKEIQGILEQIEKKAKAKNMEFEIKDK